MRGFVLAIAGLVAPVLFGQGQVDIADILRHVTETYANAKQYRFSLRKTGEESGSIQIAVQKPGRFRLEADGRVIDGADEFANLTLVSDGDTAWNYVPELHQYTKKKSTLPLLDTEPPEITPDTFVLQAETVFLTRYAELAKAADRARFLRQETVTTDAGPVRCYVLELDAPRPGFRDNYTWWVDQKRWLVLREDTKPASSRRPPGTVVYTAASIDEPLPGDLFHFTPPAGARLVERFEP
jgi:outer membrane lipoprotein-sorting protein